MTPLSIQIIDASDVAALVKAGLVLQLKEAVGPKFIMERQKEIWELAKAKWEKFDSIQILGAATGGEQLPKMAVFSFTMFNLESGTRGNKYEENIILKKTLAPNSK